MEDFTPEYQIRVNPDDLLMTIGISNITEPEILEAVRSPRAEWYESANLPRKDGGCFLIAPTSKKRFLLVALSCPDGDYVIHRVKLADENEGEISKFYCRTA